MMNAIAYENFTNRTVSFDERLSILALINLNRDNQPHCWLQWFDDIIYMEDPILAATMVADAVSKSGLVIIELESTFCSNRYVTIMDELLHMARNSFSGQLLYVSCIEAGLKHAVQCDPLMLAHLYRKYQSVEQTKRPNTGDICDRQLKKTRGV